MIIVTSSKNCCDHLQAHHLECECVCVWEDVVVEVAGWEERTEHQRPPWLPGCPGCPAHSSSFPAMVTSFQVVQMQHTSGGTWLWLWPECDCYSTLQAWPAMQCNFLLVHSLANGYCWTSYLVGCWGRWFNEIQFACIAPVISVSTSGSQKRSHLTSLTYFYQ